MITLGNVKVEALAEKLADTLWMERPTNLATDWGMWRKRHLPCNCPTR